eukprot:jgi/Botrbrau1/2003/Bobra.0052s0043.1
MAQSALNALSPKRCCELVLSHTTYVNVYGCCSASACGEHRDCRCMPSGTLYMATPSTALSGMALGQTPTLSACQRATDTHQSTKSFK